MLCPIPWGTSFRTLPHAHFKLPEHAMLQGVAGGGDPCCLARFPDSTVRLPAIAAAAGRIKAKSFTIDGEAVVLGPDGLSRFDELRGREAAHRAMLYAFDLIEHDGEDLRDL